MSGLLYLGGGINILKAYKFIEFDPRFTGWGFEDSAFAVAMKTLHGPIGYVEKPAFHLWHENECNMESVGYLKNKALFERYEVLEDNKDKIRKLINEFQNKRRIQS